MHCSKFSVILLLIIIFLWNSFCAMISSCCHHNNAVQKANRNLHWVGKHVPEEFLFNSVDSNSHGDNPDI